MFNSFLLPTYWGLSLQILDSLHAHIHTHTHKIFLDGMARTVNTHQVYSSLGRKEKGEKRVGKEDKWENRRRVENNNTI